MSLWRIAFAFLLLLIPSTMLTIERVARYAQDLRKDEMRHMTKADIICSSDHLLVKPGNYFEPLSAALGLCPEFNPAMARSETK